MILYIPKYNIVFRRASGNIPSLRLSILVLQGYPDTNFFYPDKHEIIYKLFFIRIILNEKFIRIIK